MPSQPLTSSSYLLEAAMRRTMIMSLPTDLFVFRFTSFHHFYQIVSPCTDTNQPSTLSVFVIPTDLRCENIHFFSVVFVSFCDSGEWPEKRSRYVCSALQMIPIWKRPFIRLDSSYIECDDDDADGNGKEKHMTHTEREKTFLRIANNLISVFAKQNPPPVDFIAMHVLQCNKMSVS